MNSVNKSNEKYYFVQFGKTIRFIGPDIALKIPD